MMQSSAETSKIQCYLQKSQFSSLIDQLFSQIFGELQCTYSVNEISIDEVEKILTIFIPCKKTTELNIYLGHGFGGTSLMYFPLIKFLLEHGNLVLWEIRGMGISQKPKSYEVKNDKITDFYLLPIQKMLDFYNHENIIMINHSFGCYLSLRYLLSHPTENRIKKLILLSPVGITPKQNDTNDKIKSVGDFFNTLLNLFGWRFNLTYKSPLRTICSCFKEKLIKNSFDEFSLTERELELMSRIFLLMVDLPDGSENVFFDYFDPKVIPKEPLQPLFSSVQLSQRVELIFGEKDWADRIGAQNLSKKHKNINMTVLKECGHFLPLHLKECKQVIQKNLI